MANDLHYGIGACGPGTKLPGLRIEALPANSGVITCLANDTGYENIFSHQLQVKARAGDVLIALSGSGNSPNIVRALECANNIGIVSLLFLPLMAVNVKTLLLMQFIFRLTTCRLQKIRSLLLAICVCNGLTCINQTKCIL